MNTMKKRLIAGLLCLGMVITLLPQSAATITAAGPETVSAEIDGGTLAEDSLNQSMDVSLSAPGTPVSLSVKNFDFDPESFQWNVQYWDGEAEQLEEGVTATTCTFTPQKNCEISWQASKTVNQGEENETTTPMIATFKIKINSGLDLNSQWSLNGALQTEDEIKVKMGDAVTLRVEASSSITANTYTYEWSLETEEDEENEGSEDAEEIPPLSTTQELSVTVKGSETYVCKVTDAYGNALQEAFNIFIDNELSLTRLTRSPLSVDTGASITLQVHATAKDETGFTYKWWYSRESEEEEEETNPELLEGVTTDSYEVIKQDCGKEIYRCEVTDRFKNTEEVEFEIYKKTGIIVIQKRSSETAYFGMPLRLEVETSLEDQASGQSPNFGYQWQIRKTKEVPPANSESVTKTAIYYEDIPGKNDPYLDIAAVKDEAEAYRCQVTDKETSYVEESDHTIFEVEPESGLSASLSQEIYNIISGKDVEIRIDHEIMASDKNLTYKWYKLSATGVIEGETIWNENLDAAEVLPDVTGDTLVRSGVTQNECYVCEVSDNYISKGSTPIVLRAEIKVTRHGLNATTDTPSVVLLAKKAAGVKLLVNATVNDTNCRLKATWTGENDYVFEDTSADAGNKTFELPVKQGGVYSCEISTVETSEEIEPEVSQSFDFTVVAMEDAKVLAVGTNDEAVNNLSAAGVIYKLGGISDDTIYRISSIGNIALDETLYEVAGENMTELDSLSVNNGADDGMNIIREQQLVPGKDYYLHIQPADETVPAGSSFTLAFLKKMTVVACGHNFDSILSGVRATTCFEAGFTGNNVCTNCGSTITSGKEIKQLRHRFDTRKTFKANATEGEDGGEYLCCTQPNPSGLNGLCNERFEPSEAMFAEYPEVLQKNYQAVVYYCATEIKLLSELQEESASGDEEDDTDNSIYYDGSAQKPAVVVLDGNGNVIDKSNYTLSYYNNIKPGTATVRADMKGAKHEGYLTEEFDIELAENEIRGKDEQTFESGPKRKRYDLGVTAKSGKKSLTFKSNNKNVAVNKFGIITIEPNYVGVAKIAVTARSAYYASEELEITLTINPASVKIKAAAAGKKKITLKWNKNKKVGGYQIQYGFKKKFKGAKTKVIKKAATGKVTLTGLKSKKKYMIRIRTFKKVGKRTYYSKWSKTKKVTCK